MTKDALRAALDSVQRRLRSPVTITFEVLGAAAIGAVRATVPQAGDPQELARLAADHPRLAGFLHTTWLDRVVVSPWAVLVFGLSALSLAVVLVEVSRRAWRRWRTPPLERSFANAPFSATVELPAATPAPDPVVRIRGRAGLLGVPLLHLGLVVLIVAGLVRALLASDALAWVLEGETLEAGAGSVHTLEAGFLARPLSLAEPIRLDRIELVLRADGTVERESALLSIGTPPRPVPMAINEAVHLGRARLYLNQRHGYGALVEATTAAAGEKRAVLLSRDGTLFSGQDVLADGTVLRIQRTAQASRFAEAVPLELRVLRGPALLFAGPVREGEEISWPGGRLRLQGAVPWVEIRMTDDPSSDLAWLGALLVILGITLFALVTPVDVMVAPGPPAADGTRPVRVAMRPHRFAPLHQDAFEALCERVRAGESRG